MNISKIGLYISKSREWLILCIVLAIFLIVVLFINPFREMPVVDDWAYALTVRHLVETGEFQLHPWAAPNMLFQAYWGGLFVRLLGYSFSSLRISTLTLAIVGLIAFYYLAREHSLGDVDAGLLTLGLLASPLVMRYSFSFMTDIPFLMCLVISLALYTRAIRLYSYSLMLFASVVAAAAILTRQAGIALLFGLCMSWLLSHERKQQAPFFLTGFALPAAAGLWQAYTWMLKPNWAMQYLGRSQLHYLDNLKTTLMTLLLWRPMVILQYLALFSLPFVLIVLVVSARNVFMLLDIRLRRRVLTLLILAGLAISAFAVLVEWIDIGQSGFGPTQSLATIGGLSLSVVSWWLLRSEKNPESMAGSMSGAKVLCREGFLLGLVAAYILVSFLYGYFVKHFPVLLPYLPGGEHCEVLQTMSHLARGMLTLVTSLGVILIVRILIARYFSHRSWMGMQTSERLIDWVSLLLLVQQLIFPLLGERYLLVFLPFTLILIGRYLARCSNGLKMAAIVACLATLIFSTLWTRNFLAFQEALWQAAEHLRLAGVPADRIYGFWTWMGYYRFEDYLAEVGNAKTTDFRDFFDRWLPEQGERAEFGLVLLPSAPVSDQWQIVNVIPYKDILFRERYIYVVRTEGKRL